MGAKFRATFGRCRFRLVEHEDPGNFRENQFFEDPVRNFQMFPVVVCRRIDNVQDEVGVARRAERALERGEQVRRQLADKPYRVREQEKPAVSDIELSHGAVERGE